MALAGAHTFVGFGFGAIQAGLFLYEAYRSGNFRRLVVAEVLPDLVANLWETGGRFALNIAHPDGVETVRVGPVEIYDPAMAADRERLVAALADAQEMATAIPSVAFYRSDKPGSIHRLLAAGLGRKAALGGPRAVVYAAENHNHAAEILEHAVQGAVHEGKRNATRARVQFLNTVIGKMSGVIAEAETIREHGLATVTPADPRAFLVEAFNRILISRVQSWGAGAPPFERGVEVFQEKPDLLPFEEAKLYGHNATHALGAYVGALVGVARMADLTAVPGAMPFLRVAFREESGGALVRKYEGLDPLFTPGGYAEYVDDLLARMTNPYLLDTVERVGRDPARKLGWNDRLVGTMRVALDQGVEPERYAVGAAAALAALEPAVMDQDRAPEALLAPLWRDDSPNPDEKGEVLRRIEAGLCALRAWRAAGSGDLGSLLEGVADD
jgi:mannitol-1-phosphate 5-dehydrogenase